MKRTLLEYLQWESDVIGSLLDGLLPFGWFCLCVVMVALIGMALS